MSKAKSYFVLKKEDADNISFQICQLLHQSDCDVSWGIGEEVPYSCGIIAEVLDFQETEQDLAFTLRVKKLGCPSVKSVLGYAVLVGQIPPKGKRPQFLIKKEIIRR